MAWEVWRYFSNGWIDGYFIAPEFHFTYYGFGWVKPWAGDMAAMARRRSITILSHSRIGTQRCHRSASATPHRS
jgi:hypothetical protein